ncbi:MAG: DNA-binding response regulator [Bacteroidetes bacterium]|nr:MAG: DNA-binding response regulator [Bacteroidota bacterium]
MIKVALVDDHILLRDALAAMVDTTSQFGVIFTSDNGEKMIARIKSGLVPDLVILDLNMPIKNGYDSAKWLRENYPNIKILVLTMYDSESSLIRLLQIGVRGFVKKDIHPQELKLAMQNVMESGYYYSSYTTNKIAGFFNKERGQHHIDNVMLTDVELKFLQLASTDMTYKAIADIMQMNPRTIDNYRDHLFNKLNVKSRVGLAIYAVKNGIVAF